MADKLELVLSAYDRTGKAFGSLNRNLNSVRRTIFSLKYLAGFIGSALAVREIVQASVAMEKMTLGLRGATGSAQLGSEEFAYLNDVVDRLRLDMVSSGEAFTLLTAAARGTALQGQETHEIFEAVAMASRVLGRSAQDTAGTLYAVQQMISKGKVTSEELRRQMGDRLPGAFKMAAQAMNMTEEQLDSAMRKGELYATDFLPKFAKVLKANYEEALPAALETTQAKLDELATAVFRAKAAFADSGIVDVIKDFADEVILFTQSDTLADVIASLGDTVRDNRDDIQTFFQNLMTLTGGAAQAMAFLAKHVGEVVNNFSNAGALGGLYGAGAISFTDFAGANPDEAKAYLDEFNRTPYSGARMMAEQQLQDSLFETTWTPEATRKLKDRQESLRAYVDELRRLEKQYLLVRDAVKAGNETAEDSWLSRDSGAPEPPKPKPVTDGFTNTEYKRALKLIDAENKKWEKALEDRAKAYAKAAEDVPVDAWLLMAKGMEEATVRAMNIDPVVDWRTAMLEGLDDVITEADDFSANISDAVTGAFSSLEDAIADFAATGKLNFSDFAQSIISDMVRIMVQAKITGPLAGAVMNWLTPSMGTPSSNMAGDLSHFFSVNALGNAFGPNGIIKAFASGGVVRNPTLFPYAGGMGLMGEAGEEGILPLERIGGKLGVNASGAGTKVIINNYTDATASTQESKNSNGGVDIIVTLEKELANRMSARGSRLSKSIETTYGLRRVGGR